MGEHMHTEGLQQALTHEKCELAVFWGLFEYAEAWKNMRPYN